MLNLDKLIDKELDDLDEGFYGWDAFNYEESNDFLLNRGNPIFYLNDKPIYKYKGKLYDEHENEIK
jgi:hypothetical protein